MAFGRKSSFVNYILKGSFFEAFIEYMTDEDAHEEELDQLRESRNSIVVDDFLKYANLWNRFRELVLLGEYEQAQNIVENSNYGNEMGILEIRSVLNDLAEKTGDISCYEAYWKICGSDTLTEHEYALSMLTDVLKLCPDRKKPARMHMWWLIDNTEKKQKIKILEQGMQAYLTPDTFISSSDAARFIEMAREINPRNKEALKTEISIFERDREAIAEIRESVQDGDYEKVFEMLEDSGADDDQVRRVFMRGAYENKEDAVAFVDGLKALYQKSKDPLDACAIANSVWNCDLRKNEDELNESMKLAFSVLDKLPIPERFMTVMLDALYLMEPYPLSDEKAVEMAESVLKVYPENDIALECIQIAKEQGEAN